MELNRIETYRVMNNDETLYKTDNKKDLDSYINKYTEGDINKYVGCMQRKNDKKYIEILITGNYSDMFQGYMFYQIKD